jgi:hypothetical protein
MFENITYQRPLIIGTGGGNDIVSATLVLADLQRRKIKADIAGICSPGAFHFYNGIEEASVNLVRANTQRYIDAKNPVRISYVDDKLPIALRNTGLEADVYNLSGRYGTKNLIQELDRLIKEKKYDGIIALDVGGDILARGKKDPTILSPLMDFTTLYVVSQLDTPTVLVEFGLQTDGELRPAGCKELLEELKAKNLLLETTKMYKQNIAVERFSRVYNELKQIRQGHTAVMTLKTLETDEDIHTDYIFTTRILDKKARHSFPIVLESEYFGKVFTIDLKKLAVSRELAFAYENNLELYLKTKKIVDTKNEMDTFYYKHGEDTLWLGLICPQFKGEQRKELINYGLDNLDKHADLALLWAEDANNSRLKKYSAKVDSFLITGHDSQKVNKLFESIEEIL